MRPRRPRSTCIAWRRSRTRPPASSPRRPQRRRAKPEAPLNPAPLDRREARVAGRHDGHRTVLCGAFGACRPERGDRERREPDGLRHPQRCVPAGAAAESRAAAAGRSDRTGMGRRVEPDIAGYTVLRADAPGDTLRPLTPSPIRESTFRDTTVRPGARYVYAVVAVDKAGQRQPAIGARRRDGAMTAGGITAPGSSAVRAVPASRWTPNVLSSARINQGVRHEDFHRLRQPEGDRVAGAARDHRRHHHQPLAAGEGRRRLQGHPQEDLRHREGADQRRGGGHRGQGDDSRRARAGRDRRAHRRQGAVHARRGQGLQGAVVGGQEGQRHADLRPRRRCSRPRSAPPS